MEYYTQKEIEIKESQFDKRNLYFKFTGYKMIKDVLFLDKWFLSLCLVGGWLLAEREY